MIFSATKIGIIWKTTKKIDIELRKLAAVEYRVLHGGNKERLLRNYLQNSEAKVCHYTMVGMTLAEKR